MYPVPVFIMATHTGMIRSLTESPSSRNRGPKKNATG